MQIIVRRENAITCYSETSHNRLVFPVHSCINKYAHCTQSIHWMSIYSKESWSRQRFWTGPITLIGIFLVSHFNFLFLFVPCGGLSWLPISFSLHVKYTLSYRIVSIAYTYYVNYFTHLNLLLIHCSKSKYLIVINILTL